MDRSMQGAKTCTSVLGKICLVSLILCFTPWFSYSQLRPDEAYYHEALRLKSDNHFHEALLSLGKAIQITRQTGNMPATADYELERAKILRLTGLYDSAAFVFDSILLACEKSKPPLDLKAAHISYEYGALLLERGDLDRGKELITRSIDSFRNLFGEGDTLLARCYNKLGNYHFYRKEHVQALANYSKAYDLANNRISNISELASYLQNMGIIYSELCDYPKAEEYFTLALSAVQSISPPDLNALIRLYINLGKFYFGISIYDKAMSFLNQAEELIETGFSMNHPLLGGIYWNKGIIFSLLGDFRAALSLLSETKRIIEYSYSKNSPNLPALMMDIAYCYQNLGNEKEALSFYQSSLTYADLPLKIRIYRNLAVYYLNVNKINLSKEYIDLCLELVNDYNNINNYDNALSFMRFGQIIFKKNDIHAIDYFRHSYRLFVESFGHKHRDVALIKSLIGDYHLAHENIDSALYYYHQSLISLTPSFDDPDITGSPTLNTLHVDIHAIQILGKKADALKQKYLFTKDLRYMLSSLNSYELSIYVLELFNRFYRAEESKMILASEFNNIYKNAIHAFLLAYDETRNIAYQQQAYMISEKSKAAILLTEMKDENARNLGLIPESLLALEKSIKSNLYLYKTTIRELEEDVNADAKRITFLKSSLFNYEKRYDSLIQVMEHQYPEYYRYKYEPSVINVKEVQRLLKNDEVMLNYSLGTDLLFLFFISKDEFTVIQHNIDSTLTNDIFSLRNNLRISRIKEYSYEDYVNYQVTAHRLYRILLAPVSQKITGKRLIIIPDGELAYLSFESLISKVVISDTIRFRDLPFLLKDHPISYASSATIFYLTGKNKRPVLKSGILAFAPSYNAKRKVIDDLEDVLNEFPLVSDELPGAFHEAENIIKIMRGRKFSGKDATESNFKKYASHYDILHFAMHAKINDENPLSSTLSFYPQGISPEDDLLQTYEIHSLDLKGHLAVLSACSTGDGKLQKGEGVISLARAFLYAGIPSIIMTLWDVEDLASGNIILAFYHFLAAGYDKDIALCEAKLLYLQNAKLEIETHPAFWSGYVIHGNRAGFREHYSEVLKASLIIFGLLIFILLSIIMIRFYYYRKRKTHTIRP